MINIRRLVITASHSEINGRAPPDGRTVPQLTLYVLRETVYNYSENHQRGTRNVVI